MEGERNVSIDVLWRQFQQNKTKELRDRIIEHYLPLVNVIAGRLAISLPSHVDKDDLVSSGFFGLMDAVSRYDYARGNKFETYAGVRIRGAMLDYLRSKDWISVSLRQKIRNYERTVGSLEGRLGRSGCLSASTDISPIGAIKFPEPATIASLYSFKRNGISSFFGHLDTQ